MAETMTVQMKLELLDSGVKAGFAGVSKDIDAVNARLKGVESTGGRSLKTLESQSVKLGQAWANLKNLAAGFGLVLGFQALGRVLQDVTKNIEDIQRMARESGIADMVTDDDVARIKDLNDSLLGMSASVRGLAAEIVSSLAPALQAMSDGLRLAIADPGGLVNRFAEIELVIAELNNKMGRMSDEKLQEVRRRVSSATESQIGRDAATLGLTPRTAEQVNEADAARKREQERIKKFLAEMEKEYEAHNRKMSDMAAEVREENSRIAERAMIEQLRSGEIGASESTRLIKAAVVKFRDELEAEFAEPMALGLIEPAELENQVEAYYDELVGYRRDGEQRVTDEMERANRERADAMEKEARAIEKAWEDQFGDLNQVFQSTFVDMFDSSRIAADGWKDHLLNIFGDLHRALERLALQRLAEQIFSNTPGSGVFGGLGGLFGGGGGATKAPPIRAPSAPVGTSSPLAAPANGANGFAGAGAGGGSITINNFNISAMDSQDVGRVLSKAGAQQAMRNSQARNNVGSTTVRRTLR